MLTTGCVLISPENIKDNSSTEPKQKTLAVDVAVAKKGSLKQEIQYVGTTFPVREVSLRSRIDGQLLNLNGCYQSSG